MAPPMPRLSVGCSTRLAGGRPWRGRARARRCWPQVREGAQGSDHGVVVCRLCARHEKTNNFAEGYRRAHGPAVNQAPPAAAPSRAGTTVFMLACGQAACACAARTPCARA